MNLPHSKKRDSFSTRLGKTLVSFKENGGFFLFFLPTSILARLKFCVKSGFAEVLVLICWCCLDELIVGLGMALQGKGNITTGASWRVIVVKFCSSTVGGNDKGNETEMIGLQEWLAPQERKKVANSSYWKHLSSNLFFLYIFGKLVEEKGGSFALWLSYILTGVGANLVS
ncbi:hypothetical protein TSUD_198230 [Trifolium subterraneum]|uniref:Peptidase S54 rhomboid domain-containing protein n=1 Tax=Trifolium subterraneum TaxID=3900 RepID=A0A2Z6PF04_TRISU|nr:hypothetical protein TSUD_198230 [Trifolium subterraneum]